MVARRFLPALVLCLLTLVPIGVGTTQEPDESDYYRITTLPIPDDIVLEASGLGWLNEKRTRLLVSTRRGEVWVVKNPHAKKPSLNEDDTGQRITYHRMLFGLHEPLGLLVDPGSGFRDGIYLVQRPELTRIRDSNGDLRADVVESFSSEWEINGHYHQFAFGPKLGPEGFLWVTLNMPTGGPWGPAKWRGWAIKIDQKGRMKPICPGLRSPAGLVRNENGHMFYTDNQGDHVPAGKLARLQKGVFHGRPDSLQWTDHPKSTFDKPFHGYPKRGLLWPKAVKENPKLETPAVWFPYPEAGKSQSGMVLDHQQIDFGPFDRQIFVGDQGTSEILRVNLERVDGVYQGACFPFKSGFRSGVLRLQWGRNGNLFVGQTHRGWPSKGGGSYALERLTWTGKTPFEIQNMSVRSDGFKLTFTKQVDPETARSPDAYDMQKWTHRYHKKYGDKKRKRQGLNVHDVELGSNHRSVRLRVEGIEPYYVHQLAISGLESKSNGSPLLHNRAWYTIKRIP